MDNTEYEEDILPEDEEYSEDNDFESETEEYVEDNEIDEDEEDFFDYDGDIDKESRAAKKRFEKAQRDLNGYIAFQKEKDAVEQKQNKKADKRKWYDMSPDSRMSGKPMAERFGYDKNAHLNAYKEQNFLDTKVKNPKVRIGIYLFFILVGVVIFVLHHTGVF